jgi:hypothetical protein
MHKHVSVLDEGGEIAAVDRGTFFEFEGVAGFRVVVELLRKSSLDGDEIVQGGNEVDSGVNAVASVAIRVIGVALEFAQEPELRTKS